MKTHLTSSARKQCVTRPDGRPADCQSATQQINNLRYERNAAPCSADVRRLRSRRSAGWQPAVSRIDNPRDVGLFGRPADCQPATQQIDTLRYAAITRQSP
jgi:hypothetical protein